MTEGVKTSEFWLTVIANILGVLTAIGAFGNGSVAKIVGIILAVLASMGYAYGRSLVKAANITKG